MKQKKNNMDLPAPKAGNSAGSNPPGYPLYPAKEDMYNKSKEEKEVNPEDISKIKESNENGGIGSNNEKDFKDDISGGDLDIPGSELDDQEENIGNEDEENNYYSLGGDDHNDLEEDGNK